MIISQFLLSGEFSAFEDIFINHFHTVKHVDAGDTIIDTNADRSKNCYYVLNGTAIFLLIHENGNIKTSSLRGKGTIFPLYYTYESTNMERNLLVVAQTDMDLINIPKQELRQLMIEYPEIAIAMCDAHGKYETLLLYDISSQLFDSAAIRVCSFLYIQYLTYGKDIYTTHESIGNTCGVTRATVTKILNKLAKEKIISIKRNHLEIIAVKELISRCSYTTTLS